MKRAKFLSVLWILSGGGVLAALSGAMVGSSVCGQLLPYSWGLFLAYALWFGMDELLVAQ